MVAKTNVVIVDEIAMMAMTMTMVRATVRAIRVEDIVKRSRSADIIDAARMRKR
jgi:hypothetical protein